MYHRGNEGNGYAIATAFTLHPPSVSLRHPLRHYPSLTRSLLSARFCLCEYVGRRYRSLSICLSGRMCVCVSPAPFHLTPDAQLMRKNVPTTAREMLLVGNSDEGIVVRRARDRLSRCCRRRYANRPLCRHNGI